MAFLAALCGPAWGASAAENAEEQVETLRARLRQREAEVLELRREIAAVQRQRRPRAQAAAPVSPRLAETAPPSSTPATVARHTAPSASLTSAPRGGTDEDEMLASALESALVRQGGRVLSRGTVEVEPEFSYLYDEPVKGQRRDRFGSALTVRLGLPWSTQAEVQVPYVLADRWTGLGTSSGVGDVRVGVTSQLVPESDRVPALLAFAQWRTTTGDVNRTPAAGFGQDAIQFGLNAVKRRDPIVLFGGAFYTANLGAARLRSGDKVNNGDVFGGRLGAFLAVTPDISILLGVSANSFSADRLNGFRSPASDRLRGVVDIGAMMTLARGLFLGITAGIGATPAAPGFALTVSLPYRF